MGRRPLPAVRDLTCDGRWSTYDVSVLKLYNVSFRGICARTGHPLKLPSPTKLARLGHFPPASQAGRTFLFSGTNQKRFKYRLLTRHDFLPVWLVADK
jgi:hypothetical protein